MSERTCAAPGARCRPAAGVCLPAPSGLQDMVADHRPGEAHPVGRTERIADHRLGLTQITDLNPAHDDPPTAKRLTVDGSFKPAIVDVEAPRIGRLVLVRPSNVPRAARASLEGLDMSVCVGRN